MTGPRPYRVALWDAHSAHTDTAAFCVVGLDFTPGEPWEKTEARLQAVFTLLCDEQKMSGFDRGKASLRIATYPDNTGVFRWYPVDGRRP